MRPTRGRSPNCAQLAPRQVAAQARIARGALEMVLDLLGWSEEPAISRCLDRLIQLEEGQR